MSKPSIGHNKGPSMETGLGWQRHCWSKARKKLLGKAIPIEIVRMRIKRAHALGLAYPQYASILLGTGRDIVGFLFTVDGLHLRLCKQLEMPATVQDKLQSLRNCNLISFAPSGENPEIFRRELQQVAGTPFAVAGPEPECDINWTEARSAIRAVLDPLKLPSDTVVMIGTRETEKQWAMAAKMARFIPASDYYNTSPN